MSWILPKQVPMLPAQSVRTHLLDKPLLKKPKPPVRQYQKVKIRGRVYKSITAAARQFRRHHSVIEGWIKLGKAKLV